MSLTSQTENNQTTTTMDCSQDETIDDLTTSLAEDDFHNDDGDDDTIPDKTHHPPQSTVASQLRAPKSRKTDRENKTSHRAGRALFDRRSSCGEFEGTNDKLDRKRDEKELTLERNVERERKKKKKAIVLLEGENI
ncbi:hypothetical protein B7463_g8138, partial [Scytalidium lignicola]